MQVEPPPVFFRNPRVDTGGGRSGFKASRSALASQSSFNRLNPWNAYPEQWARCLNRKLQENSDEIDIGITFYFGLLHSGRSGFEVYRRHHRLEVRSKAPGRECGPGQEMHPALRRGG
jgi:hypothetical protein